MSTKNTTNSTSATGFQFDPTSMAAYTKNLGINMPFLQGNVTDPYSSNAFQQESTINRDQAQRQGQRGVSNATQNGAAMGYSTSGGTANGLIQRAGQNTNAMAGQGFRSAITNANTRQMQSSQMLSAFQPLMTGSNSNSSSVSQQSGLGTWLPQVAGMALGAATAGMTGGASALASGIGGDGVSMLGSGSSISPPNYGMGLGGFPGMTGTSMSGLPNFYGGGGYQH